jgi:hypothetical protein
MLYVTLFDPELGFTSWYKNTRGLPEGSTDVTSVIADPAYCTFERVLVELGCNAIPTIIHLFESVPALHAYDTLVTVFGALEYTAEFSYATAI